MSANQLLLRMPTVMVHAIDDDSPLADWRTGRAAVAADSDSEVVIVVSIQQLLAGFTCCHLCVCCCLPASVGIAAVRRLLGSPGL